MITQESTDMTGAEKLQYVRMMAQAAQTLSYRIDQIKFDLHDLHRMAIKAGIHTGVIGMSATQAERMSKTGDKVWESISDNLYCRECGDRLSTPSVICQDCK